MKAQPAKGKLPKQPMKKLPTQGPKQKTRLPKRPPMGGRKYA